VDVEYDDVKKLLKLYFVPSLKQDLYLGIYFWKIYYLLPPELNHQAVVDQHELSEGDKVSECDQLFSPI